MLDKISEKILKHLICKYYNTPDKDDKEILLYPKDFGLSVDEMNLLCRNLLKKEYISSLYTAYKEQPAEIHITHKGLHYFEVKWVKFLIVWLPIIIAAVEIISNFLR